jgi:DNA mismatch endonuclease (patch repair protein)
MENDIALNQITTKLGFQTTALRSELMRKIKSVNTREEITFRKALWQLGYRYRKNYPDLPGKPDVVFTKQKIVIFIDGEFWHGFNWELKKERIKNNKDYLIQKIEKNIRRDKEITEQLECDDWFVIRFWSNEIKLDLNRCVNFTTSILEKASGKS